MYSNFEFFYYLDVEIIFVFRIGMSSFTIVRLIIKRKDVSCWNKVISLLVFLSYLKFNLGIWR